MPSRSHASTKSSTLADQLHRNVEAYLDDMVIKTRSHDKFIPNLEETFNSLRKFRWKLNATKCVFGVPQGKLLGFIVSHLSHLSTDGSMSRRLLELEPSTPTRAIASVSTPSPMTRGYNSSTLYVFLFLMFNVLICFYIHLQSQKNAGT
jgi:hypothetical protein